MSRGGVRKGAGRKKMSISTKKTVQIAFRVTEEQKKIILEKAKNQNLSLSKYLVKIALEN
jgi:uncharacterized protein (DUF1778 family)